ncbi:MAG: hypothetical protein EPN82_12820 [Bacteroidetes bacterium]|nr:MAG: hypothetical protein EPN82_12820 [Bacteroidota bacterium]
MKYITNIFPIVNLDQISSQYRVIDIKGLKKDKDYQSNKQFLIRKFSSLFKHPVLIVEINDAPKLIIKNDDEILKKIEIEYDFGRIYILLDPTQEIFNIDFVNPNIITKEICIRFLQFDLNKELSLKSVLWQPNTGEPFFQKTPDIFDSIAVYKGFSFRVVELPQSGFGVTIDATRKFTSAFPLPYHLDKETFNNMYKKKSLIYHYKDWYEIRAEELDDLNVTEHKIDGVSLIDYIRNVIPKPHSPQLANLPPNGSVINYYTSTANSKAVASGLCYEVFDFQDTNNSNINRMSIIPANERFKEILNNKRRYFDNIKYGNSILIFSERTFEIQKKIFSFPDFELGNNYILSSNKFNHDEENIPCKIAKERLDKLLDPKIGFYINSPLPNQFFVLPRSIHDTKGIYFLEKIKLTVEKMYPHDCYQPEIITYEDKFPKGTDYLTIGKKIIDSIKENQQIPFPSSGVVMIPRQIKNKKRGHDMLAAMIIRELSNLRINCSIIHDDTINDCFNYCRNTEGKIQYKLKPEKKGKFNGYLRGVAINKILLNCNKWPFILNEPLISDLTIGIDVKHHTAGFIIIDKYGKNIRTVLDASQNKEKLSNDQIQAQLYKIVREEIKYNDSLKNLVIHRDGRLFDTELDGLLKGFQRLKDESILSPEANLNIVEIQKTSFYSVRLFGMKWHEGTNKNIVENPPIGLHFFLNNQDAFLCSTGKEFPHSGTTNPLYVRFRYGEMNKDDVLNDFFKLTTLAFTKPDDCSRLPLTIKINDIKLSDGASEYNEDSFHNLEILLNNNKIILS